MAARRQEGHVRERVKGSGSFEIRYSLGVNPLTGKRRTVTATVTGTLADAKRELRRRLHAKDENTHIDPSRSTVSDFIDHWERDWATGHVSKKTFERYSELLRKHVKPHIGAVQIQKLKPVNLNELYAKLQRKEDGGAGLAPRTVGHVHRVLHRVLGHAAEWGVIQSNIASTVTPPRVDSTEVEVMSPDQCRAVLRHLEGRPLHIIVSTALATGMRRGEILALRWQDIDLDRSLARVERSLEQTHGKENNLRFKQPKTKHGRRSIALPAYLVAELRAHWKAQQEQRLSMGLGKAPADSLVFARFDGEARAPNGLTKEWALTMKAMKMGFTFHSLRHTHASQLIASGMDVLTISRRLGHSTPTITLGVYGHLFPDSDARAAQIMDAAFSGRTE